MSGGGEPGGTRTRDPLLKRQMLYRLSYRLGQFVALQERHAGGVVAVV